MNRKVAFAPEEYYHIYNRGNDKRQIFVETADYQRFQRLLFFCNGAKPFNFRSVHKRDKLAVHREKRGETLVDIGAYCLMPNHFHILVRSKSDGDVSAFMKKLCTAYSMYFNIKNGRTGKLFEGPFLAKHADSDEYLKYLFAYIHLNPVKLIDSHWKENGLSDRDMAWRFIGSYQFSSHRDYMQPTEYAEILQKSAFPEYFEASGSLKYVSYIDEWLTLQR